MYKRQIQGPTGADSTVQGPTGPQGIVGPTGEKGDQGIQGHTGLQGEIGHTGAQGIQGPTGADGKMFKIFKYYNTENDLLTDTNNYSNSGNVNEYAVVVESGINHGKMYVYLHDNNGDTGYLNRWKFVVDISPDAIKGDTGAQGIQGPTGIQGAIGPTGIQGEVGPIGPTGADSTVQGPIGPTGAQGIQGPTGVQGIQGPTGVQGIQGPTGAQGIQGPTGIQGPIGPTGIQGEVGPIGPTGATNSTVIIPAIPSGTFSNVTNVSDGRIYVGYATNGQMYILIKTPVPTNTANDAWFGAQLSNLSSLSLNFDGPNRLTYTGSNIALININSYTNENPTYYKGIAITNNVPTVSTGTISSYSMSPNTLNSDTGLTFNTSTGIISGTPTTKMGFKTYTISALNSQNNSGNSIDITMKIEVYLVNVTGYTDEDAVYIRNYQITTNSPSTSIGIANSFTLTGTLPNGLSFNTTNGNITGTPLETLTRSAYTITAYNNDNPAAAGSSYTIYITVNEDTNAFTGIQTSPALPSNYSSNVSNITDGQPYIGRISGGQDVYFMVQLPTDTYYVTKLNSTLPTFSTTYNYSNVNTTLPVLPSNYSSNISNITNGKMYIDVDTNSNIHFVVKIPNPAYDPDDLEPAPAFAYYVKQLVNKTTATFDYSYTYTANSTIPVITSSWSTTSVDGQLFIGKIGSSIFLLVRIPNPSNTSNTVLYGTEITTNSLSFNTSDFTY